MGWFECSLYEPQLWLQLNHKQRRKLSGTIKDPINVCSIQHISTVIIITTTTIIIIIIMADVFFSVFSNEIKAPQGWELRSLPPMEASSSSS